MKERIKELRMSLGMTQQKFAEKLGLKRQTIASYEVGNIEPSDSTLLLICKVFSVNKEWLETGKGDMYILVEDEVASVVSSLLEENSPMNEMIISIMKAYNKLNPDSKTVLNDFILELASQLKKGG